MAEFASLDLAGFKSIRRLEGLTFGPANVLIGANGAGKSNLLSFFRMLNFAMTGGFREFVGRSGASRLLHFGAKRTPQIAATLRLNSPEGKNEYELKLAHAAGDSLIFADERIRFHSHDQGGRPMTFPSASVMASRSSKAPRTAETQPRSTYAGHSVDGARTIFGIRPARPA